MPSRMTTAGCVSLCARRVRLAPRIFLSRGIADKSASLRRSKRRDEKQKLLELSTYLQQPHTEPVPELVRGRQITTTFETFKLIFRFVMNMQCRNFATSSQTYLITI
ncbi:unnamed protein product [Amoebophrya sp. A25]|nr:unnamed protein product [Amoebophrya sp. A25]|eukprot:GSA25T00011247001.1